MLPRTVCCRRDPRRTILRALSSSSSNSKGIAVGGIPSSSSSTPTTPRSSFAALRAQVQSTPPSQSKATEPPAAAIKNEPSGQGSEREEGGIRSDAISFSPRRTATPQNIPETPASSLRSSFAALRSQVQPAGPSKPFETSNSSRTSRWPIQGTTAAEVDPEINLASRLQRREQPKEAKQDGWGPGLREKIEVAQFEEQREGKIGQKASVDAKDHFEYYDKSLWRPLFLPFADSKAEACTVPEFRNWMMFSKIDEQTNKRIYQMGLRVRFRSTTSATRAMIGLATNNVGYQALGRHLSFTVDGTKKRTILQFEVGKDKFHVDPQEQQSHSLNKYPGIDKYVAAVVSRTSTIIQMYVGLEQSAYYERVPIPKAMVKNKSELPEQAVKSVVNAAEVEALEAPAKRKSPTTTRASQFDRRQEAQGESAVGRGEVSQARLDSIVKTLVEGQSKQKRPERRPKERVKSKNAQNLRVGISASNDTVEEHTPVPSLTDKTTQDTEGLSRYLIEGSSEDSSMSNAGGRFDGTADLFGEDAIEEHTPVPTLSGQTSEGEEDNKKLVEEKVIDSKDSPLASTSHVDESTPVFVDSEQAEGVSMTSGSEHSFEMAKKQEGESKGPEESLSETADNTTSQLIPQDSSNAVDEATPVYVDDQQAKGKATTTAGDHQNEAATSIGEIVEKSGTPSQDSSNAVDEATPVYVDDQEAKGAASTSAEDQHENVATSISEIVGKSTTSPQDSSNAVDEATPVFVDDQQAKGETIGTAGAHHEEAATSIGEIVEQSNAPKEESNDYSLTGSKPSSDKSAKSGHSDESVEKNAGAYFDGSNTETFSSSTTHEVDEATPVNIDGEQAKDTAITSGSDHPIEMAQKREGKIDGGGEGERVSETIGSIVEGSALQSNSSSKDVDDSVPVAIEGEQVGKKE